MKIFDKNLFPENFRALRINNSRCRKTGKMQSDAITERLNKTGEIYFHSITSYTDIIETSQGEKFIIANENVGLNCFAATKKIKSDIINNNYIVDEIPKDAIKFFSIPEKEINENKCMLIDINAAYPNVLKKYGIISQETFDYLMSIKKLDRLRAIGALATNKIKFKIKSGEILEHEIINDAAMSQFYFLCCYEIGIILEKCENIAKNTFRFGANTDHSFLFSWFDGIYIKHDHVTKSNIMAVIENEGYECKVVNLDFFKAIPKNEKIEISWKEENKKVKKIILQNKSINNFKKYKNTLINYSEKQ